MHREGHYGAALAAYAPLGFVAIVAGAPDLAVAGGAVAIGLAMLPDYDQRIPGLEHRGVTHTVWFALLVATVLGIAGLAIGVSRDGVVLGLAFGAFGALVGGLTIASHVAADALTPAGVTPLAPVDDRHVSYDVVRARNPIANYGLLVLGGGVVTGGALLALALVGGG
jgi:inner membrane protein